MKKCKSPREAFDHLEKWYDPESEVATQKLYDKFHDFIIPPNSNPIEAIYNQMAEKGMVIPYTFLLARLVRALPNEYGPVKGMVQAMKNRDRVEIIHMVGTRYSTLPQKEGSQWSSRSLEQAFFSSESGGRSCARRGRDRGSGGTQGRGRGGSSSKVGGSSSKGGSSSARNGSGSSDGGGSRPPGRCWRCNRRGHIREECAKKDSDFIAECARCSRFGHEEGTRSSDAAVLPMELPMSGEDLAVEAHAFVANETGKCSVMVGEEIEGGKLGKQIVQYTGDSAATCNMTPDDGLTHYRECSRLLGFANGGTTFITDYSEFTVAFRSDNGWVHVKLHDVAHASTLIFNLISLPSLVHKGHTYTDDKDGVTLKMKGERSYISS